jgi:RimJ/RimL family protein N-acetyltransferase
MTMVLQLFEGERIRLAAFEPERDAEVFSRWTHDPEYLRLLDTDPARPLSPFHVKKRFEELEKESGRDLYFFVIRIKEDDRAIGFAHLRWIEWNHGTAYFLMGIGSKEDRGRGYGSEALNMLLRYAFEELNLFRLGGLVPEYNEGAIRFLERAGFAQEVRRRQAIARDGRRWDALSYGILAREWKANMGQAEGG